MASRGVPSPAPDGIEPYRMHVSQRYLDLTRKKLELTRLPRDYTGAANGGSHAVTKAQIEPLIDYWLEEFDFRARETDLNAQLPQFRCWTSYQTRVSRGSDRSIRLHFVHRQSSHTNAIPLLFCHDWGSSFMEVLKVVDLLTEPVLSSTSGARDALAFHVVCPSIPGIGYGDPLPVATDAVEHTAALYGRLMARLGYHEYITFGNGVSFHIALMIAKQFPNKCRAIYAWNPSVPRPTIHKQFRSWMRHQLARISHARITSVSFGYTPSDLQARGRMHDVSTNDRWDAQDHDFALADSPIGLLAFWLNRIQRPGVKLSARNDSVTNTTDSTWPPSDIITHTMLYWLSGPEVALQWLRSAQKELASKEVAHKGRLQIPLGISSMRPRAKNLNSDICPPPWTEAYADLIWLRRHQPGISVKWAAWDVPDMFVHDLCDFASHLKSHGVLPGRTTPND